EPDWYACISVVRFAEDGHEKIHLWSSGYENKEKGYVYSKAETESKIQQSVSSGAGPRTCKWFQENTTNGLCKDCPYADKITSPISLGYDKSAAQDEEEPELELEVDQQQPQHLLRQDQQHTYDTSTVTSAFPLRWHGDEDPNINRK